MNEIADAISTRFKSPYFGYSLLAFFALNWRGIFLLSTIEGTPHERLAVFDSMTSIWSLIVLPLLVGAVVAASAHWVRYAFSWVSRKPLELLDIMDLEAEHKRTIKQAQLEKSRSEILAVKEKELIERAKRDEEVASIADDEAKNKLLTQLDDLRRKHDLLSMQLKEQQMVDRPFPRSLSQEEAEILSFAAKDKNGAIIKLRTIGKRTIQAGGTSFGSESPRDFARYEEALEKLVEMGLVKEVGSNGEMFSLTSNGWKVAYAL